MRIITEEILGFKPKYNYYIDENGNVYSEYSKKFLKHEKTKNGYLRVQIGDKHFLIHRLVAATFLGNMTKGYEVNHKDRNTENNNVDNLEWVTHKENINYQPTKEVRIAALSRGEECNFSKLTTEQVMEIISLLDSYSDSEIARMFNIDRKSVYNIRAHKTWKHLFK